MPNTCLLLEDDFVLRSTTKTMLEELGVSEVVSFAEADEALVHLADGATPGFALIDYRLGRLTTSESVIRELLRLGVPLAIATGLGELPESETTLAGVPVLEKPVRPDVLLPLLIDAGMI